MHLVNRGPIQRRHGTCKAGDIVEGHKHKRDHLTDFLSGEWRIDAVLPNGRAVSTEVTAPDWRLIRADVEHTITCIKDGQYWCSFAHYTPEGEPSQEYTGWEDDYC